MRNILIALCYRGTAYHGFQVQKNAPSVCAAIQDALERVLGHRPDVKGCSRTDAADPLRKDPPGTELSSPPRHRRLPRQGGAGGLSPPL